MAEPEKNVRIPVRDGRWLAGDVFRPESADPRPAILVQTPYGKERLGTALPHDSARSWLDFWDRERYGLVIVDWRGFYESRLAGGGRHASHRGEDGADLVRWVAEQDWCDGRVAGWGPSALGRALLRTGAERPAGLRCGVPLVCHMGHYYEDLYEGGVLEEDHLKAIRSLGFGLSERILAEPLSGTEFWKRGAEESRPQDLDLPLLLITGWYDLVTAQTIRFFLSLRERGGPMAAAHSRLLIGPWHHTAVDQRRQGQEAFPGAEGAATEATRAFLARWLEEDEGAEEEPAPIRYWQMGEERWVSAETWPPPGRRTARFYLGPDGALGPRPPARSGNLSYVTDPEDPVPTVGGANLPLTVHAGPFDQREVEARPDVLTFTTEVLADPVALLGRAKVTLTAVIDTVDADFAVRLADVLPDGRSMLVCDSIRRARLRGSTDLPMPLFPGMEFEIRVTLPPVARTFLPGHRIRISVSGSNWPRFERNGHNGLDHYDQKDAIPAHTTIRFGKGKVNELELPVR